MPADNDTLIKVLETPQDREWDRFVETHQDPHHEQTCAWGAMRSKAGWKPTLIVASKGGQILGGGLVLERQVRGYFGVGYLARGPLVAEGVDPRLVIGAIQQEAARRRWAYVAVSLPYHAQGLVDPMLAMGLVERPARLPPIKWTRATVVLDLSQDLEALLGGMRAATRRHVRRASQSGLSLREGTEADVPLFGELLRQLCQRRGVSSNVPGGDFLPALWAAFHRNGWIRLLIAEHQGEPVTAFLITTMGQWARVWRVGWSGAHERLYPNDFLYWESIKWAKQNGYRYFDLVGIDLDDAKRILAGGDAAPQINCSITFYKVGLGGRIMLLPGEYCYFPSALARGLFRFGGRRILESRLIGRLANLVHGHPERDGRSKEGE